MNLLLQLRTSGFHLLIPTMDLLEIRPDPQTFVFTSDQVTKSIPPRHRRKAKKRKKDKTESSNQSSKKEEKKKKE